LGAAYGDGIGGISAGGN